MDRGGDPREGLSIEGIIRGSDVGDISGGEFGAAPDDVSGGERGAADGESLRSGQSASEEWATSRDGTRESEEPSGDKVGSQGTSSVEEDAEEENSAGEESD